MICDCLDSGQIIAIMAIIIALDLVIWGLFSR